MVAITNKPAYMMEQLINKAYTAILQTGLYETPYMEFCRMDDEHQTYAMLKEHMMQVFKLRLQVGTVDGKNTAYNAYGDDENLMGTIMESLQKSAGTRTCQRRRSIW